MTITHDEQNPFTGSNDGLQIITRQTQSRQVLYRPNSTNNLNPLNPLNKLIPGMDPQKSTGTLRPVTSQMTLEFKPMASKTSANFFSGTQTLPILNQAIIPVTADYDTSKKVIDKISGKRSIHPRYLTGTVGGPHIADGIEDPNKAIGQDGKNFENVAKRPPSNLDKYIELILKGVTNVDEFIYLLRNDKNDDPYDLIVIDYSDLKVK